MEEKQILSWIFDLDEFSVPSYEQWEQAATSSLKGKPFEKLFTSTPEEVKLKPIYTQIETETGLELFSNQSDNRWLINQELSGSNLEELILSINRAKLNGQSVIHFKLRTKESQVGVEMTKLEELKEILKTSDDKEVTFFVNTKLLHGAFLSGALQASVSENKTLTGVIGHDPIGEWVKEGSLPSTLSFYFDEMVAMLHESIKSQPQLKSILVTSDPYHNGGSTAVQELAYSLSTGIEYVRQCLSRGVPIVEVASRIAFTFSVGSNMFMEIAKLRAANLLWSSIVKEFGGSEEVQQIWFHAKNSSTTKTIYDPYVNMLRATIESFSAVIGGADSIETSAYDEAFQQPTPFSERIARNVQSILLDEAYLGRVVDPSKGSWYIESLTKQVAEKAWVLIQEVEKSGGMMEALKKGTIQQAIAKSREDRFKKIEARQEKIVGVNMYANAMEQATEKHHEKLSYNEESNQEILHKSVSISDQEMIIAKLEEGLSIRQVQQLLQEPVTEDSITVVPAIRWSMKFEELRNRAFQFEKLTGTPLSVGLINIGPLAKHKPRTDFTKGFFEVGGFHAHETKSISTLEELSNEFNIVNEKVIVLCGDDVTYTSMGLQVLNHIKQVNPNGKIYIAGLLHEETLPAYKQAGLTGCIHIHTNCYQFLLNLQKDLEEGRNENA
ncbi:methylmalonyl-CoA mutase family protein [Bacillus pinisoli]|uniref:methylmalonyl-CoA mutase family protein n=1 Tax=Bacillus pinisoli TaxID=2901866 RepID=UPI001FF241DE|nr:methylmalonyl-CoA mutase family protein [Bacillus pinisoli]